MNLKNNIMFRLQLSYPSRDNYGCLENCIVEGCKGDKQKVSEIDNFQAALGYTEEIKRTGLLFDEYVFEEYKKANARQTPEILQDKITKYLSECCDTFKKEFLALNIGQLNT